MAMRKEGWCWATSQDAEMWRGQFSTREEAIAFALAEPPEPDEWSDGLWVAPYHYPEPEDYVSFDASCDIERLLEEMEERANDDGAYNGNDQLFECDQKAAGAALEALLKAWAREHVTATAYTVDVEKAERVR